MTDASSPSRLPAQVVSVAGANELKPMGAFALFSGALLANVIFGAATIVAPFVAQEFSADAGMSGLFVALFSAGFAAALVPAGRFGDRFGRRRLFQIGLLLLVCASFAVGALPGLVLLLISRVLEGVAAGIMLPQVLTTIQATSQGNYRARLTALYAAVLGLGTTAGQIGAGFLASQGLLGWRSAFFGIGVLAAVALILSPLVPETKVKTAAGRDIVGSVLLAAAIIAVIVPAGLGRGFGWPWWIWVLLASAAVFAFGFGWRERRLPVQVALLPTVVFRVPALMIGLALTGVFFLGYGAFVYLFSTTAATGLGMSPLHVGVVLAPFALAFITGTLLAPSCVARFGAHRLMFIAAIGQAVSLTVVAGTMWSGWPTPSWVILQVALISLGFAQALMYTPLVGSVMNAVGQELAGVVSGLFSTVQQVALAIGIAGIALLAASIGEMGGVLSSSYHSGATFALCMAVNLVLSICFMVLVIALAKRGRTHS